jgi:hypothetical protein
MRRIQTTDNDRSKNKYPNAFNETAHRASPAFCPLTASPPDRNLVLAANLAREGLTPGLIFDVEF